jgi:long-chain-fatty-acid---luciferin-component ligase
VSAPPAGRSPHHHFEFAPLDAVNNLDDLLFQTSRLFERPAEWAREQQLRHIIDAFAWHYERNEPYRAYCERLGVAPGDVADDADLSRIPLVPSSQFKLSDVVTSPLEAVVKVCTSSGTLGSISRVHRDEQTLYRFLGSIQCSIDQVLTLTDAYGLHLGPSREEAGDLWISYVLSIADLLYPTDNFVRDGVFDPAAVIARLRDVKADYGTVVLVGPPIMFLELLAFASERGIILDHCENLMVITAGGWKRFSGQAISRTALEAGLSERFRGLDPRNVRDSFNMVELNTGIAECEWHAKHIPPWLRMTALEPRTMQPAAEHAVGLLAFLDPTPTSYPGFVLTDDLARIQQAPCRCGRPGPTLEIVRRIRSVEARGCALKIDRQYVRH